MKQAKRNPQIAWATLWLLFSTPTFSQVIFTEDFNNYSGIQNNTQLDTGLKIAHSGTVPSWSSTGSGNDLHAVDLENLAELNGRVIQQMDSGLLFVDPAGRIRLATPSAPRPGGGEGPRP